MTMKMPPPDAYLRRERGEYEGRATLDILFSLGPPHPVHGATYDRLYTSDSILAAKASSFLARSARSTGSASPGEALSKINARK